MAQFVLTAQLQLQAPNNVGQVVNQIQNQLNGVTVNVQAQGTAQANRQIQQLSSNLNTANSAASNLGRTFAISFRRFTAFAVATRAVSLFTNTLSKAVEEAIDFERQLVKISQVTGTAVSELRGLTDEVTKLSTGLGVSSKDLLNVAQILAQAGLSAKDTKVALDALAKTALSPTFDDISETAEGAIAILAQFKLGVAELESQLGSINAVAGKFAVESGDLIQAIRRVGGVFKASGGDLNELIALFTSVRATTRESAESIATGLRTIFTRIQRPKTIEFLKQFGVELVDLEGKFVGPFEAVRRLSEALTGLGEGDITFIRIAEELGGFRQIGKVLPLLQQFQTAQEALNVAQKGSAGLAQDAATAQQALAIRIIKVKEEFLALVRGITETSSFQLFANTALNLASSLIKLADALKPIIPLLAAVAAVKIARGLGDFIGGFRGGLGSRRGYNSGGKVLKFARGGMVPGSGNRDTVPAMLQPGEFVIRKSSVNKLGASNLAAMNENKYAAGGVVTENRSLYGSNKPSWQEIQQRYPNLSERQAQSVAKGRPISYYQSRGLIPISKKTTKKQAEKLSKQRQSILDKYPGGAFVTRPNAIGGFFLTPESGSDNGYTLSTDRLKTKSGVPFEINGQQAAILAGSKINNYVPYRQDLKNNKLLNEIVDSNVQVGIKNAVMRSSEEIGPLLSGPISINRKQIKQAANKIAKDKQAFSTTGGYVFEGIIQGLTGAKLKGGQTSFDFPSIDNAQKNNLATFFTSSQSSLAGLIKADAKRSLNADSNSSIFDKLINSIMSGDLRGVKKLGQISTDKIGRSRQSKIDKKFFGGLIQKFAKGGMAQPIVDDILSNAPNAILPKPQLAIQKLIDSGGGFVDIDRTLKRTIGDQAYARARTEKERQAVLNKYFVNSQNRLNDIKTAGLTQFGTELQNSIKSGQLSGSSIRIISKSPNTPGVAEYLSGIFGIPSRNFAFTSGRSKVPLMRTFASGGGVGTDTVPALLTPGEFVVNKKSAQTIGYGNLNRMNKVGKYATGGTVGTFGPKKFANGGQAANGGNIFGGFGAQLTLITATLQSLIPPIDENSSAFAKLGNTMVQFATTIGGAIFALEAFGLTINKKLIGKAFKSLGSGKGGLGDIIGGFQRQDGKTVRSPNETFTKQFQVRGKIQELRQRQQNLDFSPSGKKQRAALGSRIQNLTRSIDTPESLTGKLGNILGKKAAGGGIGGRVAGLAARGISSIGGLGGGAIGGLAGGAVALAGPITAIAGVAAAIDAVVGNFRDLDSKLKESIEAEDTAKAQQLAVSKAATDGIPLVGNIISAFSDSVLGGSEYLVNIGNVFGGQSLAQIKTGIATQIQGAKAQKALAKASEESAKSMQEFENGTASALDVLKSTSQATKETLAFSKASEDQIAANEANKSGFFGSLGRDTLRIGTLGIAGLLGVESGEQRNKRIDKENEGLKKQATEAEQSVLKAAAPGLQVLQRQVAATGGEFDDFLAIIEKEDKALFDLILRTGQTDLEKSFKNLAKEAERTRKAFDAMNLNFQNIQAISGALSVSMENLLATQEDGYIPLNNTIKILQASITNAAQGIDKNTFDTALSDARSGLEKLGASGDDIKKFEQNLTAINTIQRNYAKASEQVKNRLIKEFQRGAGSQQGVVAKRETFANVVSKQLGAAGIGGEVQQRIVDAIAGAEISEGDLNKILTGDLSVLDKVLEQLGETTIGPVVQALQELAKYEGQLVQITKQRLELENKVIESQRNVLEAQLEAAEIVAKYGGKALTPQLKKENIVKQANLQSSEVGISNIKSGSAAELTKRNKEIRDRLKEIQETRKAAAAGGKGLAGQEGAELAAEEKRLQELAKSDYETTKKLIALKEEELKLIGEKNKLEKDSIDALVSGDIEKFFDLQSAEGAKAAIATGNAALQSAYGASALGAASQDIKRMEESGVQTLFGQQIGGQGGLTERAYGAAIGARGITDPRLAQIAAGTTAEETTAKSEIIALAETLPNFAETQLLTAQQELEAANIQMKAAEAQLQAAKENAIKAGTPVAMATGGIVYANRGIFIPRGTDTVPAMLTPGEFVVRREAVQRGNNLQILQAMNRGSSAGQSSVGGSIGMARGGIVRYRADGSTGPETGGLGINPEIISRLAQSLDKFNNDLSANIEKLNSTNFSIKLDTTNVNINFNGANFLQTLTNDIRNAVVDEIAKELPKYKVDNDRRLKKDQRLT